MKDQKITFENVISIIYIFIFIAFIILLSFILYNVKQEINFRFSSAFIVLLTTIGTVSFFLVKIYVENQLSIKEIKMTTIFSADLKEEYTKFEKQNEEFKKQNEEMKKNFDVLVENQKKLEESQKQIIHWINTTGKKLDESLKEK